MSDTLSEIARNQRLFSRLLPSLINRAHFLGYEVTMGETWRHPDAGHGHPRSLHKIRCAVDLNLFRDAVFLTSTEDHRPLGEWWEQQHPLCRWGGRFNDGNHYSVETNGVK